MAGLERSTAEGSCSSSTAESAAAAQDLAVKHMIHHRLPRTVRGSHPGGDKQCYGVCNGGVFPGIPWQLAG